MKLKHKLSLIAVTCCTFLTTSCIPGKQTSLFSNMKKEADTLIVFSPYLEIIAFDYRTKTPDSILADENKEIITRVTNQLLSSRYKLKHIEMPALDSQKLSDFFFRADNAPGANNSTRQQTFFPELKEIDNNQLAMFITFHAEYNSVTTAITGSTSYGASSVRITPSARPRSDLRLIIFNMQTNEIIFYNRYDTRSYSANSPADVERMTRKILRDIYYK